MTFYCPHTQNLVHRRGDREWTIKRKVSAKKAQAYLDGAIEKAKAEAARRGIEWENIDAYMRGIEKLKQVGVVMRAAEEESRRE